MKEGDEQPGRGRSGFVTGVLVGAVLGAATALLLAPASGEETRRLVRRRAKSIQRQAAAAWIGEREVARKALKRRRRALREKLDEAAEQMGDLAERAKDRLRS
jgi:gas vesicle protein